MAALGPREKEEEASMILGKAGSTRALWILIAIMLYLMTKFKIQCDNTGC